MPARHLRKPFLIVVLLAGALAFGSVGVISCVAQTSASLVENPGSNQEDSSRAVPQSGEPLENFAGLEGLPVTRIAFEGIDPARLTPLPDRLAQDVGKVLTPENLASSLRQAYATGLFETVEVYGLREDGGVALIFKGNPRLFVGRVTVVGAKGATINTQLIRASRLSAGTRFTEAQLSRALDEMRQLLADNGFHEPVITHTLNTHFSEQLVDIEFEVASGPQARVGDVQLTGDAAMSLDEFRRKAHLAPGARIDRDTVNRALSGVLKEYQKQNRLEAEIKLESQVYSPATKKSNFQFSANRGPIVQLRLDGAKLSSERLKHAIPIYEEGTVDEDLLNEGDRRLRDYFQRLGYFAVKVEHQRLTPAPDAVTILYSVSLGDRSRVERVSVSGNHYFDSATLKDLLNVHVANTTDRHGAFSQALVSADIAALQSVYRDNGFSGVKITSSTNLVATADSAALSRNSSGLAVDYHIDEGNQQRVGTVALQGNDHLETQKLLPLMNTAPGQLLSPQNLAGDRDTILTDYLSRGFGRAQVDVTQQPQPGNAELMDVTFHITEGPQFFVKNVLLTGLHFTRPDTVARAISLHSGDPLNQTALLETQRNLYDFALFNEVDTAIENPNGSESNKTILVQTSEARRWTFTYGAGFETQTGTPQNNCAGYKAVGTPCNPNGKTGISPRVLGDLTRNNLFGREQSASIQGTYGLLEQKINLIYQVPHLNGSSNLGLSFTGGYANSQDVTTYVASKLDAGMRVTQHYSPHKAALASGNTLVYEFDFRRVKVAASSLQVFPVEISLLSTAVRVAGPGMTWLRDTRDSPLDAHRGSYTSFQEFFSSHAFGSQAQFNRLDVSSSSFYSFKKNRFVLARNTRYAQERAFGAASGELIPLPERLYAGGPSSLRGFSINAAGPRDPETGFPIGGAGALANSFELRLPPPTLPGVGDALSIVLFEDMGNIFTNAGDAWASALRIHQPDRNNCRILTPPSVPDPILPGQFPQPAGPTKGPDTSTGQQGICSFNYFSHAPGLGLRYHTPVGPIRLDFSYNLNPPIYPVNVNYSLSQPATDQHVGQAAHFNFVFSLGQTF